MVATAQETVVIAKDDPGIGTLASNTKVATVSVVTTPDIVGTETRQLTFPAKDALGATIALTPGSAFWSLSDGGDYLTLTNDGVATGKSIGSAHVRVTIDGVASTLYPIEIDNDPDGAAAVLDFDALPSVDGNFGTTITLAAQLKDQYLSTLGIRFTSTAGYAAVVQLRPGEAPSGSNAVSGSAANGTVSYSQANEISMIFFDPRNPTTLGATKRFSLTTDNVAVPSQTITLIAYDAAGNVVDQVSSSDNGGDVLTVQSSTATIHRVVLVGSVTDVNGIAIDNVTFRPVVPVATL